MLDYDITIIEFLDSIAPKYLDSNDITVTKFLDSVVDNFLYSNDITVTKFLADTTVSNYKESSHGRNNPMPSPRNWRSYRRDKRDRRDGMLTPQEFDQMM